MKAITARKFIITFSICASISLIMSVYGFMTRKLSLTFYSLIVCSYLLANIIDILCTIVKVSSGLTVWEHLRKLIDRNERNL